MKKMRLSRFIVFVVTALLAIAIGLFFIFQDSIVIKSVSKPVNTAVSSVDEILNLPFQLIDGTKQLFKTNSENKSLKRKVEQFEGQQSEIEKLKEENTALRKTLKIKESFPDQTVLSSKVIVRSPVSWLDVLTIDLGEKDGVTKNMLVLSNGSLVGKVAQTTAGSSSVKLLSNTKNMDEIPVKITAKKGDVFGILTHYDIESRTFEITQLTSSLKVQKGDAVTTSGLDGQSTEGISVGKVVSEEDNSNNLSRKIIVKPAIDLSDISHVTLVGD
ncbi:rod shape-determining protein MreC [Streptococcus ratti]|uniref:Cell shape-determining protein MreC n=1 Tax=Streptococcus ratti FA-1 = DSM 20564 TaxID=699248 RepID=A0ABP2R0M1_STRRT|nr:rod shape-determining protein MreC [Streptococcus ratti]EJN94865.1 putative cell shape-determining protein MreC [Streptococcus ratti FA-1 = DSM 20564]EMP71451.1 putative cell shape-determining protein [Streptococcus ratti FA-1 = DSM 20564]VEI59105.1 putative cell shape-determining protein [Streptococcus mutans]